MNAEQFKATYREEAAELLAELETSLLALGDEPGDADLVGRVFRALHTIKGSGAMFGFDAIARFTHEIENAFDRVRKGEAAVTTALVEVGLAARDRIRTMLDEDDEEGDRAPASLAVLEAVRRLGLPVSVAGGETAVAGPKATAPGERTYRICFRPPRDIFRRGGSPVALVRELAELGTAKVVLRVDDVPTLEEIEPDGCWLGWDIVLTTTANAEAIREVFLFFDDADLRIDLVDDGETGPPKKIGEILVERGDVTPEALERALAAQRRLGDVLLEQGAVKEGTVTAALVEQQVVREQRERRETAEAASSIRVRADRLDSLVNLVGELVTVQARFSAIASNRQDAALVALAEDVERLTWELRDTAMGLRMMPIGTTFGRLRRLVHDLSRELGKDVELVIDGAETELDKTVIEKLGDPLVHLVRNAIDHGVEAPDARELAGKPRAGTLRLAAEHSGSFVVLRVEDDGAGLDAAAIRAKAIERGLLAPTAEPSERELYQLILQPGFSTARAVTNVSGRGVGMDVVRQAIEAIGGSLDIASVRGRGTTFTVRIPLTLAIIDGLLVSIGDAGFIMPLAVVQECIELTDRERRASHGRDIVVIRDHFVPYVRLREKFAIENQVPAIEQIVVTEVEGQRVGFVVDRVVGEHQTVIKSLGRMYRGVEGISGSTILGDGSVALVLDIPKLVAQAVATA